MILRNLFELIIDGACVHFNNGKNFFNLEF